MSTCQTVWLQCCAGQFQEKQAMISPFPGGQTWRHGSVGKLCNFAWVMSQLRPWSQSISSKLYPTLANRLQKHCCRFTWVTKLGCLDRIWHHKHDDWTGTVKLGRSVLINWSVAVLLQLNNGSRSRVKLQQIKRIVPTCTHLEVKTDSLQNRCLGVAMKSPGRQTCSCVGKFSRSRLRHDVVASR